MQLGDTMKLANVEEDKDRAAHGVQMNEMTDTLLVPSYETGTCQQQLLLIGWQRYVMSLFLLER